MAGLLLAVVMLQLSIPVRAQQPPAVNSSAPAKELKQMEEMNLQGGAMPGAVARLNRMTDPNAGKRPGDEKLNCDQIKAQFDDTDRKYTAQEARQDAAAAAMEADARKYQAEVEGPGAIATGFFGGLAAIGAQITGSGDAYNEKLKADLMVTQKNRQSLQNRFSEEAEATKALSDRGQRLMNLGKAKGCKGLGPTP
ncbi:MAG: hypothetical protein H7Y61_16830 [Rhizobiales bacterium]|nr:hypothetical protein [Rhizobacter sp.]